MWNLLTYIRPKYVAMRDKKKNETRWNVLIMVLFGENENQEVGASNDAGNGKDRLKRIMEHPEIEDISSDIDNSDEEEEEKREIQATNDDEVSPRRLSLTQMIAEN